MTSGQFKTFPVASIFVNRAERQRRNLNNIAELAQSIARVGLIHPPVIRRSGELVVGERRLTAVKTLGWTEISVQFIEELSEEELHKVELEENLRRLNLTWDEECKALQKYHSMRVKEDATWTINKTAEALGIDGSTAGKKLLVASELAKGNKDIAAAPRISTAINMAVRKQEREKQAAISSIIPVGAKPQTEAPPAPIAPLLNADFAEWARDYQGDKFNLLHCDFPYGVGQHKSNQASQEFGKYSDRPEDFWNLLDVLAASMNTVVHDSAHLIFWFSMDFYAPTREVLEKMGWKVNPFPLIWLKSDNTGIIPDVNRGPRRIYETAFFASRGDRKIVNAVSNGFSYPGSLKEIHQNEKPIAMLRHFLRMVTDEYTSILDPTCGSANALRAARSLGATTILGIERNPEFFTLAKEHYFDTITA